MISHRLLHKDTLLLFRIAALFFWLILAFYITGLSGIIDNYILSISMMLGAFIGSATPVGGGVVAFPVLTFIKHVPSDDAAIFCLAMQSFGMTAASIAIFSRRIKINKFLIGCCITAGTIGYVFALIYIPNPFSPGGLKVFFSSFWLAFGIAIYILNKGKISSEKYSSVTITPQKLIIFLLTCFSGGIITSWIGNGIDVVFFCSLILIFSEKESVATPSAVVVMALISILSTIINIGSEKFTMQTLNYLSATIPVVIFFAPLGVIFATQRGDAFIRKLLLIIVIIQYLTTAIVFFKQADYILLSLSVIACSIFLLFIMTKFYKRNVS